MNADKLTICPRCSSDACYTTEVSEKIRNHFCYGCGFQSNSLMKEGELIVEEQEEILPELYKDLKFEDETLEAASALNIQSMLDSNNFLTEEDSRAKLNK